MGLVIDTSALVAAERVSIGKKDPGTEHWEQVLGQVAGESAVLPAATYAELLVGVELAENPTRAAARRARIDALTMRIPIVEFDAASTPSSGESFIWRTLVRGRLGHV